MFKLLILDVDGVLTSGRKTYDKDHNVLSKEYCDKDFTAIKRFIANGIPVILLSGDKNCNEGMAYARGLPFYFSERKKGKIDKLSKFHEICYKYNVSPDQVCALGDDWHDLQILQKVKYRYCPKDAIQEVKNICQVLPRDGGNGVVAELAALYKEFLPNEPLELESDSMWEGKK